MQTIIVGVLVFILVIFGFNNILGPKKEDIILDLDKRSASPDKQAEAVEKELERRGRHAQHKNNGEFVVDGKLYIIQTQNVLGGAGISSQRVLLKPVKD